MKGEPPSGWFLLSVTATIVLLTLLALLFQHAS